MLRFRSRDPIRSRSLLRFVVAFNLGLWTLCQPLVLAAEPSPQEHILFNGRDLSGWQSKGAARWEVDDGVLIGRQGLQNQGGDLLSTAEYGDFELKVIFRMDWPGNSGVWYRYKSSERAYQADILEYRDPLALTGSLYCTGKMFIARNTNPELIHRDGWNTLMVRAVGDRHMIMLNGTTVADVRDALCNHGRIGFQVHSGSEFVHMRVLIKEVALHPL